MDGSEDNLLTAEVRPAWERLGMFRERLRIEEEVGAAVASGRITAWRDYQALLEPYDNHLAMREGEECLNYVPVENYEEPDVAIDEETWIPLR